MKDVAQLYNSGFLSHSALRASSGRHRSWCSQVLLQETAYAQPQFDLVVTGAFAVIALALVVIGVFSLMANTVLLQTHEIDIRLALGAIQKNILEMVLIKGLALVSTGLAIGLVANPWLTRLISS